MITLITHHNYIDRILGSISDLTVSIQWLRRLFCSILYICDANLVIIHCTYQIPKLSDDRQLTNTNKYDRFCLKRRGKFLHLFWYKKDKHTLILNFKMSVIYTCNFLVDLKTYKKFQILRCRFCDSRMIHALSVAIVIFTYLSRERSILIFAI